jgi:hypothetical protein
MRRLGRISLAACLAAAAAAAVGCKGTSAPTGFGVNITVDASSLSAADRMKVTNGLLDVSGDETAQKKFDVHAAIQSGQLRFRYIPNVQSGSLRFSFTALDASDAPVASGSAAAAVTLAANAAVSVEITLAGGTNRPNGTACASGGECKSTFCVDGVCCNEACTDTCVSCALGPTKGMCTPYAEGTDPEMECGAKQPPSSDGTDAGATTAADAAPSDGGASASDGATSSSDGSAGGSDALVINTPDGGFSSTPAMCAGTCGGARACKYPDSTKSCGKSFCNDSKNVVSFVCDGNGGCTLGLAACTDYTCDSATSACGTRCTTHSDCLPGSYCNGNSQCVPTKGNSIMCTTDAECQSGHCSSSVCCNTDCQSPNSCNMSGKAGMCVCPGVTCAAGVACKVYYADADHDTYGDPLTTKSGCEDTVPAGYVDNNTDCDDNNPNVHPGQTTFFATARSNGTFDYDCDGAITKETSEFPGGACKFCGAVGSCSSTTAACAAPNTASAFVCPQELVELTRVLTSAETIPADGVSEQPPAPLSAAAPAAAAATVVPPICVACLLQCCGCHTADRVGFTQAVACGATATATTCGPCNAMNGGPTTTVASVQQRCR